MVSEQKRQNLIIGENKNEVRLIRDTGEDIQTGTAGWSNDGGPSLWIWISGRWLDGLPFTGSYRADSSLDDIEFQQTDG